MTETETMDDLQLAGLAGDGRGGDGHPVGAKDALKTYFGFEEFLEGQEDIITEILEGRDGLAVMPTGGGKSLCYQLPALCLPGVTLVVSPLIALMKDQVDALLEKGVAATLINSTLSHAEQKDRISRMCAGEYKLVYVAPERFRAAGFCEAVRELDVSFLAIDEAHCLSQWGHDFRPDYMRLGKARKLLGDPQCVAFTATATEEVRKDIIGVLDLEDPFQTVTGFARPNLSFNITAVEKVHGKYKRVREVVEEHKTGIIYCATRKKVEEVAETLNSWGVKCVGYHGGMSEADREATQNKFISRAVDVAVATNAFGMGIDRSDVRFVVHFEIPGSVEAFYQEAGRAGRDGESAWCELLFNYADTRTQEFFIDGANPGTGLIRDVYQYFLNAAGPTHEVHAGIDEVKDSVGAKNGMAVSSAIATLSRNGYIERFDVSGQRKRGTRLSRPDVLASGLELDEEALEEKERRDRGKLQTMVQMCYGAGCRQRAVLEYFGEMDADDCGTCDVCCSDYGTESRDTNESENMIVRKVLSGVARMSRKQGGEWEGRFGRGRVVQMLTGSKSQEIMKAHLQELTTYGILSEAGTAFLNELMHALHDAGLLVTQRGEYPLVTLTKRGEEVMRGNGRYRIVWPQARKESMVKDGVSGGVNGEKLDELAPFDGALFDRLRDQRNDLAQRDGVPSYVVFTNKTLEAFARLRPKSVEAGLRIKGVGPAKAEKYLEPFLKVIEEFEG
jgi:ATP-dependent DNA helicase RecQ